MSKPSDVLAARRAADTTLNALLLGLGAVALLVGGVGVANTMVISVLERRAEIGLRRSLGAARGQIRLQFLAESLLLSALGGIGGVLIGVAVTTGYAAYQTWPTVVPAWATAGALAATLLIGGTAGLYPAIRAARLSRPKHWPHRERQAHPTRGYVRCQGLPPCSGIRRRPGCRSSCSPGEEL